MKSEQKAVCSSGSIEGLTKLINKFYASENYIVKDGKACNTKTQRELGEVRQKKGRYYYHPF